jgi:5-formyltetrahydrofolate cyclo-ligase
VTAAGPDAKAAVRQRVSAWRRGLAPGAIRRHSEAIRDHLLAWPRLAGAHTVLGYVALAREPQTADLLAALAARGCRVCVPEVDGAALALREGTHAVEPAAVDAALVPGLAFDRSGWRLGRGGGHYDRLLPGLRLDCLRVGVCFAGQVLDALPVDPWDEPVDWIVTERGLLEGAHRRGPGE